MVQYLVNRAGYLSHHQVQLIEMLNLLNIKHLQLYRIYVYL